MKTRTRKSKYPHARARILSWIGNTTAMLCLMVVLGCKKSDQPSATQNKIPIIIGHQADLSGGISSWGYWLDKAAKAAVDEVNAAGGIDGRPVKLVVEDTETKPETGTRKLRKLIQEHRADFVLGSVHSGVMMASLPIAEESQTLYFPVAMAAEATAEKGNRFVFRINSHVREQVQASADWVVNDPAGPKAKKWSIFVSDYAWGWSHEEWFTKGVSQAGGQVLASVRIPQNTKDFVPYLAKVPKETEAVYFIFFGADSLGFIQQLHESGYKGNKFTAVCTLEAIDIAKLGAAAEGAWVLEYLPRQVDQKNLPAQLAQTFEHQYHRDFRKAIRADESGHEIGSPDRVIACSHCWATYELVHLIKEAVEKSGWKTKADNAKLIKQLEGMTMKLSSTYPQGDKFIRPEDHQGFHQHWMSRVENGILSVKFHIPTEGVTYPAPVDFRKN